MIEKWWCDNLEELLINKDTILLSCFMVLQFDILMWSKLGLKKHIIIMVIL